MTALRRFLLTLVAVAGCSSAPPRSTAPAATPVFASSSATAGTPITTAAVTAPAPRAAEPAQPGNMSGGKEHAMANCPAAVPGARIAMIFTDDGIELLITAPTPDAQKQIRRLAHAHAMLSEPSGRGRHSGRHGGPGRIGYCPIVHTDRVIVTAVDTSAGVRVRMRADGGYDAITALQELVALRVAGLPPVMPPGLPATTVAH